jgi:ATP-dependent RNA helicase DeaD
MTEFAGIAPAIAEALAKRGYETLTPVQQAMLDPSLGTADALVSAQTGSGKTVAFGLALAPTLIGSARKFAQAGAPLALVIAPTRELALQVMRELDWLYEMAGATIASCVGGMDMRSERRTLERGAHIVVGTPGRLCDHIRRGSLDISGLKAVVLDEADEMLDLGFREDLEFILEASPADRRTLMFSATVPRSIATLAKSYQRDAVRIGVTSEQKQHGDIEYRSLLVAPSDRENAIINVLRFYEARNAIVFCSTRAAVNHLTARFNNRGFSVVALSGELSQNERTHALQAMRDGRARVCIATDVAARGIDLPSVSLVIHVELPRDAEALQHRSGRTGRAGRKGTAVLIVPFRQRRRVEMMLKGARIDAEWIAPPEPAEILAKDRERLLASLAQQVEPDEEEKALAERIMADLPAEAIAAALVRSLRTDLPAPEDIIGGSREKPREDGPRQGFEDANWFRINAGRRHNADPRWLLPLICRYGHVGRAEIGAIRIAANESYFQVTERATASFIKALRRATIAPEDEGLLIELSEPRGEGGPPRAEARPTPSRAPKPAGKVWSRKGGAKGGGKPKRRP